MPKIDLTDEERLGAGRPHPRICADAALPARAAVGPNQGGVARARACGRDTRTAGSETGKASSPLAIRSDNVP